MQEWAEAIIAAACLATFVVACSYFIVVFWP